jgi:hypothetical protein
MSDKIKPIISKYSIGQIIIRLLYFSNISFFLQKRHRFSEIFIANLLITVCDGGAVNSCDLREG